MPSPEEQIERLAFNAVESFGHQIVDWMKDMVGTNYPPSSEPYNPPHKRTGNLQAGIGIQEIAVEGSIIRLTIESTVEYSAYLEYGTDSMTKRPFMVVAQNVMEDAMPVALQANFDGYSAPAIPAL